MAERRSLGEAMLTPDKLAFIQRGTLSESPKAIEKNTIPNELERDVIELRASEEREEPTPVRSRSRSRRNSRQETPHPSNFGDYSGLLNVLVPLTTRLQPATAVALRRAGLEQRLRGQAPATVQEIAEEAVAKWLRDAGYLE